MKRLSPFRFGDFQGRGNDKNPAPLTFVQSRYKEPASGNRARPANANPADSHASRDHCDATNWTGARLVARNDDVPFNVREEVDDLVPDPTATDF